MNDRDDERRGGDGPQGDGDPQETLEDHDREDRSGYDGRDAAPEERDE